MELYIEFIMKCLSRNTYIFCRNYLEGKALIAMILTFVLPQALLIGFPPI